MRKLIALVLCLGAWVMMPGLCSAEGKPASPHESVSAMVAGKKITIEYGRPYKKGRNIFGELVPWSKVWRTGADQATTIETDGTLTIGTVKLQKGKYGLFTVPGEKEWTLIFNKVPVQWGAYKYDEKQDVGRTPMKVGTEAAPVEQFTIALEPQADKNTVLLKMSWDKTVASAILKMQ